MLDTELSRLIRDAVREGTLEALRLRGCTCQPIAPAPTPAPVAPEPSEPLLIPGYNAPHMAYYSLVSVDGGEIHMPVEPYPDYRVQIEWTEPDGTVTTVLQGVWGERGTPVPEGSILLEPNCTIVQPLSSTGRPFVRYIRELHIRE